MAIKYELAILELCKLAIQYLVKLHQNDTPWMTPYLKDLIHHRQKALKENNTLLFKFYRNKVNR
jgi:hypothetical protein